MEIEDIINKVRFTSSEDKTIRTRSLRESTDTSIISESKSAPESISSCLEPFSSDEYATYDSDASRSDPYIRQKQVHVEDEAQRKVHSPPRRRRARTTPERGVSRQMTQPWPLQGLPQQQVTVPCGHAMGPMHYYPAYMVAHIPMSPATHIASHPGSFDVPQRQLHPPEPPQRTYKEEEQLSKPHSRGVRLPPLPELLRRAQTVSKRKPPHPKTRKKRIRVPPVVHEYDHLSVEEALQELARRNIRITDMQQVDISKANLVRLLQRADRNNNTGSGNPNEFERTNTPA